MLLCVIKNRTTFWPFTLVFLYFYMLFRGAIPILFICLNIDQVCMRVLHLRIVHSGKNAMTKKNIHRSELDCEFVYVCKKEDKNG